MTAPIRVSLLRRSGEEIYYMQYRHPVTGGKIRRSTGREDRRGAERAAARWESVLREGREVACGRMPWETFRERYEAEVLSGLADRTFAKAVGVFSVFERQMRPAKLASVTAEVLSAYATRLRELQRAETTIKGHLAHLRAALAWAVRQGWLPAVPKIPPVRRARRSKVMRGRPVTPEEFQRMLAAVPATLLPKGVRVKPHRRQPLVDSWRFLLHGLWLSGLRLDEAVGLTWHPSEGVSVHDLDGPEPMFLVPAHAEKAHTDRILPMAPEFAEWLRKIPHESRTGHVFNPLTRRHRYGLRPTSHHVGTLITRIGRMAGVIVDRREMTDEEGCPFTRLKHASAHDLRRSFGERWASRVMPAVLKELMRHESIDTTLKYYVGRNARATATVLWEAHRAIQAAATSTPASDESPESPDEAPNKPPPDKSSPPRDPPPKDLPPPSLGANLGANSEFPDSRSS